MGIQFPISPSNGNQYTPPGIPVTWQYDSGRNAWRVVRGGTPWTDITGKPATFPPSAHQHPISDVTNLQSTLNNKQDISAQGQVNGYPNLDQDARIPESQLPFGLTGDWNDLINKPSTYPPSPHTHPVAEISDSGSTGQQVVRAPTPYDARQAIGAIGIDDNARVTVEKDSAIIGVRRAVNFIEGTNVSLLVVDDPGAEAVDITINSAGGTAGGSGANYTVSDTKPLAPLANDLWLDTTTGILFTYYNDTVTGRSGSSQWIESLPYLNTMPTVFTAFDFPSAPADGQLYNPIPGATWKWSTARGVWFAQQTVADAYTRAQADAKFVDVVGDVMTGPLTVVDPPTAAGHAASKAYVDSQISGGTVNKTYVDTQDALKVAKAGDTMTGDLTISKTAAVAAILTLDKPTSNAAAIRAMSGGVLRWQWNMAQGPGDDLFLYCADNAGNIVKTPLTITRSDGLIQVAGDPVVAGGIATKQYVDGHVSPPPVAATAAEYISNSAPTKMLTSGAVWGAAPISGLADAATLTPDFSVGLDFVVLIAGAGRTLANPTNQKPGQKGLIYFVQDGTGGRTLTGFGTGWRFAGGVKPTLTIAPNGIDIISYHVYGVNNIFATFNAAFG